jgi:uncharacterized membrane protein YvlD (DUF360 family)
MLNQYLAAIPRPGKLTSASPLLFSAFILPLNFTLLSTFAFVINGLLDALTGT